MNGGDDMKFVQVLTLAVFIGAVLTVQPDPLIEGNTGSPTQMGNRWSTGERTL